MIEKQTLHILLIDNYDSFSYNLVELFRSYSDVNLNVLKNDDLAIFRDDYDAVVISPGPGLPSESAFLMEALDFYIGRVPVFGICLGLQAIVEHFDGELFQLDSVFHGIKDKMYLLDESPSPIFNNIKNSFIAGRYHSWVASENHFPKNLTITARDSEGNIMAVSDDCKYCYAVQFHPESYMTDCGAQIVNNFIALTKNYHKTKRSEEGNIIDSFS